jgi:hypothetical protein
MGPLFWLSEALHRDLRHDLERGRTDIATASQKGRAANTSSFSPVRTWTLISMQFVWNACQIGVIIGAQPS